MPIFPWDETCSVHVRRFDMQHQKLFAIVNRLEESASAGRGEEILREVIHQLAIYTRVHFLQEETVMDRTGYSGLSEHKSQHSELMAAVEGYKRELDAGRPPDPGVVLEFLRQWLLHHILKCDKAYACHLNANGVH